MADQREANEGAAMEAKATTPKPEEGTGAQETRESEARSSTEAGPVEEEWWIVGIVAGKDAPA